MVNLNEKVAVVVRRKLLSSTGKSAIVTQNEVVHRLNGQVYLFAIVPTHGKPIMHFNITNRMNRVLYKKRLRDSLECCPMLAGFA